jgi:hypothetical protein
MKSFEFPPAGAISCSNLRLLVWAGLSVASVIASACGSENAQPTVIPIAAPLSCPECELVEVLDVIDANIVRTSAGEIQMYGAYVLDQPADCAELASERLRPRRAKVDACGRATTPFNEASPASFVFRG